MSNKFQAIKPFRYIPNIKRDDFNYEFVDYTWFKNFLSSEECDSVKALWNPDEIEEAMVSNSEIKDKKEDLRKSSINFLKPGKMIGYMIAWHRLVYR